MELHTFTHNAFSEQTYLLDHGNGEATVIDPGMNDTREQENFANFCKERGLYVVQMLLTHAHLDHVLGAAWVHEQWGVKPRLHRLDGPTYEQAPRAAAVYGVPMDLLPELGPELIADQLITCGPHALEVKFTPGHAPGHVVFVCEPEGWVIGGDVLFAGSVGRTDLPGCNPSDLVRSIEEVMYELPDSFTVWPGHGPATTIGQEKRENPFVNAVGSGMMQRG
jgi:hydroxyacylglutathione hydrolase